MPKAFSVQFYVICTSGLVVDFKLDGSANFSASMSTVQQVLITEVLNVLF